MEEQSIETEVIEGRNDGSTQNVVDLCFHLVGA
jgi:hypothetical protein